MSMVVDISMSGVIDDRCVLNAKESLDKNSLSTKLFMYVVSAFPSTDNISFFKG